MKAVTPEPLVIECVGGLFLCFPAARLRLGMPNVFVECIFGVQRGFLINITQGLQSN